MKTVELGNTGSQVSQCALGTMYFGTGISTAMSHQLLDQYVDAGGSFLDTANNYAHWMPGASGDESETVLGEWISLRKNRQKLFLASKVGFDRSDEVPGLKASQIIRWFEHSLQLMKTDYLDLYYAHCDDRDTPLEESLEAFDKLVKAGKVRYLGASNYRAWRLNEAIQTSKNKGWAEFCCIQQRKSYLYPIQNADFGGQVASDPELEDYCSNKGITLLAYKPLLGGAYNREDKEFPSVYVTGARLDVLVKMAEAKNLCANQLVLAWLVAKGNIPVMAASNIQHMKENLQAMDIVLSEEEINTLDNA